MNTNRVWMHRYFPILVAFVLGTALGYLIAYVSGVQPSFVPLVSAVLGLVVAFSVPLWQALFVNAPKLSVEISAIDRILSDEPLVPDPIDTPELKLLRMLAQDLFRYQRFFPDFLDNTSVQGEKRKHTLKDLEQLLSTAQQRHEDLPKVIEDRKQELEKVNQLTESTFTRNERNRLLNQLNASAFSLNESVQLAQLFNEPDKPLDEFKEIYKQQLEEAEKLYNDLQRDLPTAERKLEQLRKDLYNNNSFFTVSASLINSGRSNTAIKVPALLRVSIGEGNYIDLKLSLQDFENKSEISANGTRIVVFKSPHMSALPEEDRRLINTYWGQSVSARLLLEDIHAQIYSSHPIAFAAGLYQKIIYDRLARFAGSE